MSFCLFRIDGAQVVPLPGAAGPWMPDTLSGSAVGPLIGALSEDILTAQPMLTTRISIEFLRPVPMKSLDVDVKIVREGRKQQVIRIGLACDGKEVVAASLLRLRRDESVRVNIPAPVSAFQAPAGPAFAPALGAGSEMLNWIDSRVIKSNGVGDGSSEAWFRYFGTVIEGRALTPLMRAAMLADFGNGLAPAVDWRRFTYMNADISLHLARLPRGEWLHVQSRTVNGGDGLAQVGTELGDADGTIGWAHQSLLLERRSAAGVHDRSTRNTSN